MWAACMSAWPVFSLAHAHVKHPELCLCRLMESKLSEAQSKKETLKARAASAQVQSSYMLTDPGHLSISCRCCHTGCRCNALGLYASARRCMR